jgi:hypothetical protein
MRSLIVAAAVLLFAVAPGTAGAQPPAQPLAQTPVATPAQNPTIKIPRVTEPPVLEKYLDGTIVPPGAKVSEFWQREPGDGVPASLESAAYLSYDATHLYVVYVCKDDPAKVRANLTKREAIMGDDIVGLLLDPYHDGRRAYEFFTNPLGIQLDGVAAVGQDDDWSYDALWQSDGKVTTDGYVVVMKVPFKSLRFSNARTQTWGVAVARIIPRANETSFWPYVTRRIAGFGQQLATLEGLENISPGRNLQAIPYGNFATAREMGEDGVQRTDNSARVGIDAKAVIKDAVTLDVTVNPDFSQVESDEPQVTINQRFEVFFPEKRPFFIENANYFETPENLFHSRRIADPKFGTRVTGKGRGWAFGGLLVNDKAPGESVEPTDPRSGKMATIGVARVQREFGEQSYVGGIYTDREWGPAANRVFGIDGRWRMDDNWSIQGQWVGSRTIDTQEMETAGSALTARVARDARNFSYESIYLQRSPDFRSELGFIERVDMKETQHEAGYNWFPTKSRVLRVGADLEVGAVWDWSNLIQDWSVEPGFEIEFPGQTEIGVRHWQRFERFEGIEFRRQSSMVRASTEWLKWLGLNGGIDWGENINYYPAEGVEPFLADGMSVEAGATIRPLSQLRLDLAYIYSGLTTTPGTALPAGTSDGTIFTDHIIRTRVNYQFTKALSGRVIFDYETLTPNTALVDLERERSFNADVLFTYLVNPWTAVYVGYSDAYENWPGAASPMLRPLNSSAAPLTSVGRQVFVKISYLLKY